MAFLGGAALGGKAAGALGAVGATGVGAPLALVAGLTGLTFYGMYKLLTRREDDIRYLTYSHGGSGGSGPPKKTFRQRQEDGEMDSSEVANFTNLGVADTYANIKRHHRNFSKGKDGDKGYVEADHIPPLESLRRARDQPEFPRLRYINPNLYNLVESLENDPRGENLLTVQVATHHHRDALSTGRSHASTEARLLLACRIARGEVEKMLKQAFIIAHPYSSQQIRDDAGIGNRPRRRNMLLTRDRTMRIYTEAFVDLLEKYCKLGIINSGQFGCLVDYVVNYGYLDRDSDEYREILDIVKRFGKPQN